MKKCWCCITIVLLYAIERAFVEEWAGKWERINCTLRYGIFKIVTRIWEKLSGANGKRERQIKNQNLSELTKLKWNEWANDRGIVKIEMRIEFFSIAS